VRTGWVSGDAGKPGAWLQARRATSLNERDCMPKGSFKKAWREEAAKQKPGRRLLMWAVAGNDDLMADLERAASVEAKEKNMAALPWGEIISLLLPLLLKLLEKRLNP